MYRNVAVGFVGLILGALVALAADEQVRSDTIAHFSGALASSESIEHAFLVDPAEQLVVSVGATPKGRPGYYDYDTDSSLDYIDAVLVDPTGRRIDFHALPPQDAAIHRYVQFSDSFPLKGGGTREARPFLGPVRIDRPLTGRWRIQLSPREGDITYSVSTSVISSLLQISIEWPPTEQILRAGEPIPLVVTIRSQDRPVTGATVATEPVFQDAGGPLPIRFVDDGTEGDRVASDGRYEARPVIQRSGDYHINDLHVGDQRTFERLLSGRGLVVHPRQTARWIAQPTLAAIDQDGDGKYEEIRLTASVQVLEPSNDYLQGLLWPFLGEGQIGLPVDTPTEMRKRVKLPPTPGRYELTLRFSGAEIRELPGNGPYTLSVGLYNADDWNWPIEEWRQLLRTPAYHLDDFESKP